MHAHTHAHTCTHTHTCTYTHTHTHTRSRSHTPPFTHTTTNRFLPSVLRAASQPCSRHAPIVITSGLNYKFSITHLGGGKQCQNFIQVRGTDGPRRKREREKKERSRKRVGGRNESSTEVRFFERVFSSKKKKKVSISLYWWSHKTAHTKAYRHT